MKNTFTTIISKSFLLIIAFLSLTITVVAQDEEDGNKPVRDFFACSMNIDNQTVVSPFQGGLEFIIHHRMGTIKELEDLYGIYAPSNIRLGVNYGITDNLMIGFGTEKNNKLQEFQLKYSILDQTRSGSMPIALSFFGNVAIDAREKSFFGENYKFTNRLSYFAEVIVARKFCNSFSMEIAPNFSHFNAVDSLYEHDALGISVGGRAKIYNEISFIFEYDQPLEISGMQENDEPMNAYKPNYAFGVEFGTGTHAFQIFASTFKEIVMQKNYLYNTNEFKDLLIGFNITVRM